MFRLVDTLPPHLVEGVFCNQWTSQRLQTITTLHSHAAPGLGLRLFFFVIVRLVTQSDAQFLELPHPLTVDVQPWLCGAVGTLSRKMLLMW